MSTDSGMNEHTVAVVHSAGNRVLGSQEKELHAAAPANLTDIRLRRKTEC